MVNALSGTGFDWSPWSELLGAIVTPDGRVDYEELAARRPLLARVVAALGTASPDTHPDVFPSPEDALAYWINEIGRAHV